MSRIFKLKVIAKNRCSRYRSYRPILVDTNTKNSQNGWINIIKLYYRWNPYWACIASKYRYTKSTLPISISKCWPTDNPLLQVYINLYTGTKNRYWWYCGYMHVPVPKGYIDIGLVLIRIASRKPLILTNLHQYAY